MTLLAVDNLTVQLAGREVVRGLSLRVDSGQTLAIIGESGSGKSVSLLALLGLLDPSAAAVVAADRADFNGSVALLGQPRARRRLLGTQIGLVSQEPMSALNPFQPIGAQICEHYRGALPARQRAAELLEEVGIRAASSRLDDYPHQFSGGMRQRVLIAMALVNDPQLLICDEPTTALDVTVQAQLLALLNRLASDRQLAVIMVSHDLAVVAALADQVVVMRHGEQVDGGAPEQLFRQPGHPYTAQLLAALPQPRTAQTPAVGAPLIAAERLQVMRGSGRQRKVVVDQVSLAVGRGEIVGLVGESGSGKSTLGRAMLGLLPHSAGSLQFDGQPLPVGRLPRTQRAALQLVFQDPLASLNPRQTIAATLAEPLRLHGRWRGAELAARVVALADQVELSAALLTRLPSQLSGGQRQRVAIGRALACRPQFLVADEAVSALDLSIQAEILQLLQRLVGEHRLALLFISHDLGVVRSIAHRVAVMEAGRIVEQSSAEQLWQAPQHPYTQRLLAATLSI